MGAHNEHNHAALHGIKARLQQRDEFDVNKFNFIHIAGLTDEDKAAIIAAGSPAKVVTIVSQVTVTEPKTFPGPAVYVTKTDIVEPAAATDGGRTTQNSYESAKSAIHANTRSHNSYESAKSAINQPHHFSSAAASFEPTAVKGQPLAATRSSSAESISEQSHGMSGGAKAGLAFGIIIALALVAGLAYFCVRRKKKQIEERGEKIDEKHASQTSFFSGTAAAMGAPAGEKRASVRSASSAHTAATAPRLSLRPVTQFLPGILDNKSANNNASLNVPPMSEKPRSASPQNPFADARSTSPSPSVEGAQSNHSAKASWESSDSGAAKVGTAAAVPVGAAGASPPRGPNNVHRVQLEFKPSMDDELELKSGQLVRMLHEYDDGWALCIRMDRSQQGVCPRTCLSKLPVKPRPQGPPPQGRPQGPPPAGFRGPPPQGPNKMMPRPLTPTGRERSNTAGGRTSPSSPQEANRNRSQSVSNAGERSVSPIDSGMPARKPVPGQAS